MRDYIGSLKNGQKPLRANKGWAGCALLNVLHVQNIILAHAAGGLHFGNVAFFFANHSAGDGRIDRNLADFDVGFVVAHDLIGGFFVGFQVRHGYRCAKHDFAFGVDFFGVDDLRVRELAFQLGDAPFNKAWRSLAASYSAFSDKSPCERASAMAAMTSGRATL